MPAGGRSCYHAANNQVYVGFVVHLNYENPYLSPYEEFQRFKHHPMIARLLSGGKAGRLWRARADRGRLAVDPAGRLSGRRAAGLFGGADQRAPDQGQPQRHVVGHAGGRSGTEGDRRAGRARTTG
jgi:hypothetical protein